jgi:hypothetical protein
MNKRYLNYVFLAFLRSFGALTDQICIRAKNDILVENSETHTIPILVAFREASDNASCQTVQQCSYDSLNYI